MNLKSMFKPKSHSFVFPDADFPTPPEGSRPSGSGWSEKALWLWRGQCRCENCGHDQEIEFRIGEVGIDLTGFSTESALPNEQEDS